MKMPWPKASFSECLEEISRRGMPFVVKRLSGNDTGLTGGHQAGVYLPRVFFKDAVPQINTTRAYNPRVSIECFFPANGGGGRRLTAIYYNSKFFPERGLKKKYNEFRVTGWGGQESPAQNSENTGCIFVFALQKVDSAIQGVALVAESPNQENQVEEWLGQPVEPGQTIASAELVNWESPTDVRFPEEWKTIFPNGADIFDFVLNKIPRKGWHRSVDELLLARRKFEFTLFSEVERAHVLPQVSAGFRSVNDFIRIALAVSNRRKARTGRSLELNLASIFNDEGVRFSEQVETEHRKRPDFIFPSEEVYRKESVGSSVLTMLAAKTCCKDRWRQVISEASKVPQKHLFTLQEGVSANQLAEMKASGVQLVVPAPNLTAFPKTWRSEILGLKSFVQLVKDKQTAM